jgi:hypothetical protein
MASFNLSHSHPTIERDIHRNRARWRKLYASLSSERPVPSVAVELIFRLGCASHTVLLFSQGIAIFPLMFSFVFPLGLLFFFQVKFSFLIREEGRKRKQALLGGFWWCVLLRLSWRRRLARFLVNTFLIEVPKMIQISAGSI